LVIFRRGIAGRQRLFDQRLDHYAVFGMQIDHTAVVTHLAHGAIDVGIVDHEDIRVRHVELDTRDTICIHHIGKFAERSICDIRENGVESVIHAALGFGSSKAPVERGFGRLTFGLHGKVDDCRGAAECRRPGASLEAVAGFYAVAHGRFHVHVCIDTAGQYQQSVGVMHGCICHIEGAPNGLDPAILEQDISCIIVNGSYDSAILDQHFCHEVSPPEFG
jgi:hypothetical protein